MRRADVAGGVAAVAPAPPLALALPLLLPPLTLLSLQLQKQQQKQQQNSSKSSGKSNSKSSSKNSSDRDPLFETRGEATRTAAAGAAASVFLVYFSRLKTGMSLLLGRCCWTLQVMCKVWASKLLEISRFACNLHSLSYQPAESRTHRMARDSQGRLALPVKGPLPWHPGAAL